MPVDPSGEREQDFGRAANAMASWLLEHVHDDTHQELCELHPDVWRDAAEVAVRAARGEFDTRPLRWIEVNP